jgi:hypothetical protein
MLNETFSFDVDKSIINHLIHSQNGTISTSLRELIMNSIDANCNYCEIVVGYNGFSVIDDGDGFGSKQDILNHFKTFGKEHDDQSRTYGRFRIGRGQIMSFATVSWHSGPFNMVTDIANKGLEFQLIEDADDVVHGCKVSGEFYSSISDWDLQNTIKSIKNLVKYSPKKIILNGEELVNNDVEWGYEDDDVKIHWKSTDWSTDLNLYNIGIYVRDFKTNHFGVSADVVTKKPLKLNMARNEINESDPLWIKIKDVLSEKADEIVKDKVLRSRGLNVYEKEAMISNFKSRLLPFPDIYNHKLLKDCRGKYFSFKKLVESNLHVTISPDNDNAKAERISVLKKAIVLHHGELKRWGFDSLNDFMQEVHNQVHHHQLHTNKDNFSIAICDFNDLAGCFSDSYDILEQKELSKKQKAFKSALLGINNDIYRLMRTKKRVVYLGESDVAEAWTDGDKFIVFNTSNLGKVEAGAKGALYLVNLMIHEYCHDVSDQGSHEHNFEFYEKYHDFQFEYSEKIASLVQSLTTKYANALERYKLKVPNRLKPQKKISTEEYSKFVIHKADIIKKELETKYKISNGTCNFDLFRRNHNQPIHDFTITLLSQIGDLNLKDSKRHYRGPVSDIGYYFKNGKCGNGDLNLKINLSSKVYSLLRNAKINLIELFKEKHGLTAFKDLDISRLVEGHIFNQELNNLVEVGNDFMESQGFSGNCFANLLDTKTIEDLMNCLCEEPHFNIRHYSGLLPSVLYLYGSDNITFKTHSEHFTPDKLNKGTSHITDEHFQCWSYNFKGNMNYKDERFQIALNKLEHSIQMLKGDERDEFRRKYLNELGLAMTK